MMPGSGRASFAVLSSGEAALYVAGDLLLAGLEIVAAAADGDGGDDAAAGVEHRAADAEEALVLFLIVHGVAALADELQLALQVGHVGDGVLRHGGKADLVKAVAGAFGVKKG